jgi:hypothetical protein
MYDKEPAAIIEAAVKNRLGQCGVALCLLLVFLLIWSTSHRLAQEYHLRGNGPLQPKRDHVAVVLRMRNHHPQVSASGSLSSAKSSNSLLFRSGGSINACAACVRVRCDVHNSTYKRCACKTISGTRQATQSRPQISRQPRSRLVNDFEHDGGKIRAEIIEIDV